MSIFEDIEDDIEILGEIIEDGVDNLLDDLFGI